MVRNGFLLDTNVLSEPLKPSPNAGVLEGIRRQAGRIATASICWNEMWYGCLSLPRSKRRDVVEAYVAGFLRAVLPILPYDAHAAEWHATERSVLTSAGMPPPFLEGQIAAVAYVNGLTLVTRNLADFRSFRKLAVVNWHL